MKPQSLILYGSAKKLTKAHKPVTVERSGIGRQPAYFVRADLVNMDYEKALNHARPMEGEVVLNTVPVESTE